MRDYLENNGTKLLQKLSSTMIQKIMNCGRQAKMEKNNFVDFGIRLGLGKKTAKKLRIYGKSSRICFVIYQQISVLQIVKSGIMIE